MPNHFHTDAVQIVMTAIGVLIVFHLIRMAGGYLMESDNRFASGVGKGAVGLVTFGA